MKKMLAKHPASWAISALTIFSGIVALIIASPDIQVPIHWNAAGEVDRTTTPFPGFFMMPFIQTTMLLLLSNLHLLEPRKEHLEKSQGFLHIIAFGCTILFAGIQGQVLATSFGFDGNVSVIFLGVGLLLAIIGNYLGKLQSTFTVGIRTPWTLSSEDNWRKTHRLGGKLMVGAGTIIVAASLLGDHKVQFYTLTISVITAATVPMIYSWLLWRKEQIH